MTQTLTRRMRLTRIAPHLAQAQARLSPLANQLKDRLREKTCVEDRIEGVAAQLDVFERVYEMSSQRISDYKSSRQSHTLEWVIIVLLAAETLILFIELLWTLEL